jgi:hypothetical protein
MLVHRRSMLRLRVMSRCVDLFLSTHMQGELDFLCFHVYVVAFGFAVFLALALPNGRG